MKSSIVFARLDEQVTFEAKLFELQNGVELLCEHSDNKNVWFDETGYMHTFFVRPKPHLYFQQLELSRFKGFGRN